MKRFKLKLVSITVTTLLITGCGTGTGVRNLKTYPAPTRPELSSVKQDEAKRIFMEGSDFKKLTEYVIRLNGQLEKCNNQSSSWNQ